MEFKLKSHRVNEAVFREKKEFEKKRSLDMGLSGNILVPKEPEQENGLIAVKLVFTLGKEEERIFLKLETITLFSAENTGETKRVTEESARKNCVPAALAMLRETVKSVTEAYGLSPVDLPPFEEEITDEETR